MKPFVSFIHSAMNYGFQINQSFDVYFANECGKNAQSWKVDSGLSNLSHFECKIVLHAFLGWWYYMPILDSIH